MRFDELFEMRKLTGTKLKDYIPLHKPELI